MSTMPDERIEEQSLSHYHKKRYYPVKIGDIYNDRYRVIAKLGYGAASTVWLTRDATLNRYSCLKVCVCDDTPTSPVMNELKMLRHLREVSQDNDHPGLNFIRLADDIFEINGEAGRHFCIASRPEGISVRTLQQSYPDGKLPKLLVQSFILHLLFAINWLHVDCSVIHTDISSINVLTEARDGTSEYIEERESQEPSIPSTGSGSPVYSSRAVLGAIPWKPILTDFGNTRPADPVNNEWCMPDLSRAPEVLLQQPWGFPVDIWSLGIMTLSLLEGKNVFDPLDRVHNQYVLPLAVAQYISMLGPPSLEMIKQSPSCSAYFDEKGNWALAECPIPQTSLEDFVTTIPAGEEKDLFLTFIRKILTWDPEARATSHALITDEWLSKPR